MPEGRPVWVTGAGGFLGAAVCRRLLTAGIAVRPVVRKVLPALAAAGDGRLLDPLVADLVDGLGAPPAEPSAPAVIVHFAAEIPAAGATDEIAARNRQIDDNVFAFAARIGAGVVFASSGSVYGETRGETFVEGGPVAPATTYAAAKLRSEELGARELGSAGLPFAALRVSAPYGPGLKIDTVTRIFITRALAGRALTYDGSGSRAQDFVYVADVADAVYRCVALRASGSFNIARGEAVSTRALAETVAEVVGGGVQVLPSGRDDPQEGRRVHYSVEAAAATLGWRATTSLRRGLELWCEALREEGDDRAGDHRDTHRGAS